MEDIISNHTIFISACKSRYLPREGNNLHPYVLTILLKEHSYKNSGGQYLTGGGTFSQLDALSDDDWNNMRELIRSANNKDKADRS